jgi:chaperonin GroES
METADLLDFSAASFYQIGGYFMTSIRPLHDRVIVQRLEQEEKSAGGIIIPDAAKEKPIQGEVIAVGPGGRDETGKKIPMDVKVGDIVLFGKWAGTEVKLDGEDFLVLKESDIIGVVENKGAKKKAA